MNLETLAIHAVGLSLSKTERISAFLNDGDKEPSWDGNIYIHENERRTKRILKKLLLKLKERPHREKLKIPSNTRLA